MLSRAKYGPRAVRAARAQHSPGDRPCARSTDHTPYTLSAELEPMIETQFIVILLYICTRSKLATHDRDRLTWVKEAQLLRGGGLTKDPSASELFRARPCRTHASYRPVFPMPNRATAGRRLFILNLISSINDIFKNCVFIILEQPAATLKSNWYTQLSLLLDKI